MPIIDIQRRLTQLGVIRLGRQVPTGKTGRNGQPTYRPEKLDRFRVTSPDEKLIAAVASTYGGTAQPWKGPSGPEFEVITDAKSIPVLVPPQKIDPNYEMWGNGFKARLCDGETERLRNSGCLCVRGQDGHIHDFVFGGLCECGVKRECKPTTRLSLMLAEIPGLGVWKLESHGRNAAAELPMTSDALESAPGPVPATLVVHYVEKKILLNAGKSGEKIEPRSFYVPRLVFDFVTPQQAFSGQLGAAARAALGGGGARQAIGSTPAATPEVESTRRKHTARQLLALVRLTKNLPQLNDLSADAQQIDPNDPDLQALRDEWQRKAAQLKQAAEAAAAPVEQVVEAEIVTDEAEGERLWNEVLAASPWPSTSELNAKFKAHQGVDMPDADHRQLATFLAAVKAGEVR